VKKINIATRDENIEFLDRSFKNRSQGAGYCIAAIKSILGSVMSDQLTAQFSEEEKRIIVESMKDLSSSGLVPGNTLLAELITKDKEMAKRVITMPNYAAIALEVWARRYWISCHYKQSIDEYILTLA